MISDSTPCTGIENDSKDLPPRLYPVLSLVLFSPPGSDFTITIFPQDRNVENGDFKCLFQHFYYTKNACHELMTSAFQHAKDNNICSSLMNLH